MTNACAAMTSHPWHTGGHVIIISLSSTRWWFAFLPLPPSSTSFRTSSSELPSSPPKVGHSLFLSLSDLSSLLRSTSGAGGAAVGPIGSGYRSPFPCSPTAGRRRRAPPRRDRSAVRVAALTFACWYDRDAGTGESRGFEAAAVRSPRGGGGGGLFLSGAMNTRRLVLCCFDSLFAAVTAFDDLNEPVLIGFTARWIGNRWIR